MFKLFIICTTCKKKIWIWQSQISSATYNEDFTKKTHKGDYHYNRECYPEYDLFEFIREKDNFNDKEEKTFTKEEIADFIKKRGEIIDP